MKEYGQGLTMTPVFYHMHIMTIMRDPCAITLPLYKYKDMGKDHEALHHWNGRAERQMDESFGMTTF